ncbi:MAG TPA: MG2 domain-containing protein, partial [Mycobacterium sp.]
MATSRYRLLRVLAVLLIFLLGCPPPSTPDIEAVARTGLRFLGEIFWLAPNSTGSIVIQVTDPSTGLPIANSRVKVSLAVPDGDTKPVFTGTSDEQGLVRVSFDIPDDVENPNQVLVVESTSSRGTVVHEEAVYVGRAYNILVSTDKPVYQPGQTIHVRALALDSLALKPADAQPLNMTVTDPAGNKVFHRELTTSDFGVAAVDFPVDSLATSGDYVITAEMGPVQSTRTVEVKPYNLPRFKVEFVPDKEFYLPGETATGEVRARYFFGKPVADGDVSITAYVTDVDRFQVHQLSGATDADGVFRYEFAVPDYFVGRLDNQTANLDLEITVFDTADHPETIDESVTIAERTLLVDAVPESGALRPGLENIVYLDVSYPDGRAAPASLEIASSVLSETVSIATDDNGLAEFRFTPPTGDATVITVTATTAAGESTVQPLSLDSAAGGTTVLLRPD